MKESDITRIVVKFEKLIGPVAGRLAKEVAEDMRILKGDRISPQSEKEYNRFVTTLSERYSKILGKGLVKNMVAEAQKK